MTLEERIRELILARYPSVKDFAEACGVKYTTICGMLARGMNNSNVSNAIAVCKALNIDVEALSDNEIVFIDPNKKDESLEEYALAFKQKLLNGDLSLDGVKLSEREARLYIDSMEIASELIRRERC